MQPTRMVTGMNPHRVFFRRTLPDYPMVKYSQHTLRECLRPLPTHLVCHKAFRLIHDSQGLRISHKAPLPLKHLSNLLLHWSPMPCPGVVARSHRMGMITLTFLLPPKHPSVLVEARVLALILSQDNPHPIIMMIPAILEELPCRGQHPEKVQDRRQSLIPDYRDRHFPACHREELCRTG